MLVIDHPSLKVAGTAIAEHRGQAGDVAGAVGVAGRGCRRHPGQKLRVTGRGAELAIQAIAVVEAADAAFFQVAADPAALLAMLRPLASDPQDSGTRLDLEAGRAS
jgi:hypothetical protein